MQYGKMHVLWVVGGAVVCALWCATSGCSARGETEPTSVEPDMGAMPKDNEAANYGVHVQLAARQQTWGVELQPVLHAKVFTDPGSGENVFLATHLGSGCRVRIDGRWYAYPEADITGVAYANSRAIQAAMEVRLNSNWRAMDGGEALALSIGPHTVQFAWAGYVKQESKQQPLLLLSNEVEIVISDR